MLRDVLGRLWGVLGPFLGCFMMFLDILGCFVTFWDALGHVGTF